MSDAASLISLHRVVKTYGTGQAAFQALAGVDLDIASGEFVAIMGPSGSGKSTALNILGCLDTPSEGSYLFRDIPVETLDRNQRALLRRHFLGFVFQGFNLLARTSAQENVELPLLYRGEPSDTRYAAARAALAQVGLAGWEGHTPGELSGGQQQRVAIARAIVTQPLVLLADEPTGNLDSKRGHEIMDLLVALNREQGITVIMVTHEPDMAGYAGRVVRFVDGRVESDSPERRAMTQMLLNALLLALRAIRRNLMRSFLTVLGIVIGVAAVVTMVTLGNGATRMVADQIASLGSNLLILRPGQQLGPGRDSAGAPNFKLADVDALQAQVPALRAVAPVVGSRVTLVAGGQNWQSQVSGTSNAYFAAGNWTLAAGRQFEEDEERAGKAVCVIGATVRKQLFGGASPLGGELRVKNFACEVVGLLAAKGQGAMGQDQDDVVLMPVRTVQRRLVGNVEDVSTLMLSMRDGAAAEAVMEQVRRLMRERRKLAEHDDDNFNLMDTKQIAQTLSGTIRTMTGLLGAVAAVSLLVGGIGIMNIMLVSVTERTREIGIRLAIGALEHEVLLQFLIEAVVLSALGGLIGIVLAFVACLGLTALMHIPFLFNPGINLLAFGFSAAIGVVFGYMPARRAASLDPIVALRYE